MRSLGRSFDGTEQFIGTDAATGDIILNTKYADTQAITDRNAELRKAGAGSGKEMRLAASIPLSVIMKWRVEEGVDIFSNDPDQKRKARQLLNDHQYRMLRIWEGNI